MAKPKTKLTPDVLVTCELLKNDGTPLADLAKNHGVTLSTLKSRMSSFRKTDEGRRLIKTLICPYCFKTNDERSVNHHTSYYPEKMTRMHSRCHGVLHKEDSHTLLPPSGDSIRFYKQNELIISNEPFLPIKIDISGHLLQAFNLVKDSIGVEANTEVVRYCITHVAGEKEIESMIKPMEPTTQDAVNVFRNVKKHCSREAWDIYKQRIMDGIEGKDDW